MLNAKTLNPYPTLCLPYGHGIARGYTALQIRESQMQTRATVKRTEQQLGSEQGMSECMITPFDCLAQGMIALKMPVCCLTADAAAVPASEHAHGCVRIWGRAAGLKRVLCAVRSAGSDPCNWCSTAAARRSAAAAGCSTAATAWHAASPPAAAWHAAWRTWASPCFAGATAWRATATAWPATAGDAGHRCSRPCANATGARMLHAAMPGSTAFKDR